MRIREQKSVREGIDLKKNGEIEETERGVRALRGSVE